MSGAAAAVPVGRVGDPDDFGAAVAFLCSEPARFITGAALQIDGGAYPGLMYEEKERRWHYGTS